MYLINKQAPISAPPYPNCPFNPTLRADRINPKWSQVIDPVILVPFPALPTLPAKLSETNATEPCLMSKVNFGRTAWFRWFLWELVWLNFGFGNEFLIWQAIERCRALARNGLMSLLLCETPKRWMFYLSGRSSIDIILASLVARKIKDNIMEISNTYSCTKLHLKHYFIFSVFIFSEMHSIKYILRNESRRKLTDSL